MKHLIITSSDSKYGDFLTKHWIISLKENVKLDNIDVVVLDYGLTYKQIEQLNTNEVEVIKCIRDGHVTSLRYRDLQSLLLKEKYDQVLMMDGGDIIFQSDISHLFEENKNSFRAVTETVFIKFEYIYHSVIKSSKLRKEVLNLLEGKEVINGGFILASSKLFIQFCNFYINNTKSLKSHGIDQVLINYYLYKNGFIPLSKTYNYMLVSNFDQNRFQVKDKTFYDSNNNLIHVVHNLGGINMFRGMKNFGYKQTPKNNFILYIIKFGNKAVNKFFRNVSKLCFIVKTTKSSTRTKNEK